MEREARVEFHPLAIEGPVLIVPRRLGDARGLFCETFRADLFAAAIGPMTFVQDNHAVSAAKGTLRGLHVQAPPMAQGKLVRVIRGAVLDVAVDIRRDSPGYGRHVAVELSARNWHQLWVPPGFLHGYCTLEPETELLYKVTQPYSPAHDGAVAWNDPDLAIAWPFPEAELVLSGKDRQAPRLRDLPPLF